MPSKKLFDFSNDIWNQGPEKAWAKHSDPDFHQYNLGLSNFLTQNQKVQEFKQKEIEQRNLNFNSILALSKTAGETDSYASNLYNRINDISNITDFKQGTEALSGLKEELTNLQEKATTKQYGGVDYLADFASGSYEIFRDFFKKNLISEKSDYFAKSDLESYLRKDKLDYDSLKSYSTPDDILNYVDDFVGSKRFEVESVGGPSEEDYLKFYKSAQKAPKETAYKDMLLSQLDVKFKTPGSNYYRDPNSITDPRTTGDIYVNNFQNTVRNAVKETNVKDNFFNEATFAQYDLEKEGLGKAKYKLEKGRNRLLQLAEEEEAKNLTGKKPKENPLYKQKIDDYTDAINGYTAREKELDNIYGVKVGDRSGTLNSTYHRGKEAGINFVQFFMGEGRQSGTFDAKRALAKNAGYLPEVIDYDKYGNPVLSSQVFYETSTGTKKNWGGFTESGFGMAAEMIPTLLLTKGLTGMLEKTAAAETIAIAQGASKTAGWATKTLESLNKLDQVSMLSSKIPLVGGPLKLGSRVMTMASVYPTVYERIRQEELKWGGDVDSRSRFMAFNEAATEGLGFPEFGGLKVTGYMRGLGAAARTATDIPLTRTQRYLNFMRGGADFAKTTLKINFLESMEEEMALFGEYLISKGYEEEYKKAGREQTTMDGAAMTDTFIESFKSGLIYSGFNSGMRHYQMTRPDALRDYSRYEAAQNPELFKAKLMADFKKNPGTMTEKDLQNGIIEIDNLSNLFKSLESLDNLKDLATFLGDEDSRFKLFTRADQRNTLINLDFDSLTEEQREELGKYKLMSKIGEKGQKKLDALKIRTAELHQKAENETLTPEEQKEYTEGQVEYNFLAPLSRYKELNKRDLNDEQIKYLTENGIIQDKDFEYTKEDLDKMISDVDTDILKTEKRAFKYASMSESEKRAKIKEIFDQKIELISEMEEPIDVFQSYAAIKKDYEYLDKNVNNVHPEVLENKKRLMNAYGARYDQLTNPTENGRSAFENKLAETNFEEIINNNDLIKLRQIFEQLERNSKFIDEGQVEIFGEVTNLAYQSIIGNLVPLEGQQKLKALLPIFNDFVKEDSKFFYEPDLFKRILNPSEGIKVELSDQEFEQLRNDLMEMRGKKRSQSLAETGRYDNVDAPAVVDEVVPGSDELSAIASQARNASTEADESGKSEKRIAEDEYFNKITKGKVPSEVVNTIKTLINNYFTAQSPNSRNIVAAIDDYIATRDKVKFEAAMRNIEANIETEIRNARLANPKSERAKNLEQALDNIAMWKRTLIKLGQNPATVFTAPVLPVNPVNPEGPPPGFNPNNPPIESEEVDINIEDGKKTLESLDSAQKVRRLRVLELMSSLRTAAVEVTKGNVKNTEVAVVRRVKHLESLAMEPIVHTKVMNRRQFMRETIASLNPEKKSAEIEEDLAIINALFADSNLTAAEWDAMTSEEKDAFLEPMNQLVGKNLFDDYALRSFIQFKGKGLIVEPAVIVTIADEKGKLSMMDGVPSEFNFVRETTPEDRKQDKVYPNIPWRISDRVGNSTSELVIGEAEVKAQHSKGFENRKALVKYLQQSDDSVLIPAEITEGVLLSTKDNQSLSENEIGKNTKLEDFMLAENASTAIFGKNFKFSLGRLYYNNNGNPVILGNTRISEEDAKTLARLVFSTDPSVINSAELKDYLYSIVNQIDKDNKLMFYEGDRVQFNDNGTMVTQYVQLVNPVLVTKGKGKKLTEEEFAKELMERFYKVDRKYLVDGQREGEKLLRFKEVGQQDGTYKLVKSKESYIDYIKRTHTIPVDGEGNVNSMANKSLYLDQNAVDNSVKTKKLIPTEPPVVPPPAAPIISEEEPVGSKGTLTPKLTDEFSVVPFAQVPNIIGTSVAIPEASYIAALAALKANPNNLLIVNVMDTANKSFEYTAGDNIPSTAYHIFMVKVGDKVIPLVAVNQSSYFATDVTNNTNNAPIGTIQVTGKGNKAKFNVGTVAAAPKTKISLEELTASINETSQNPFDASQVKEAEESKENCKVGNRLSNAKNKSKGPQFKPKS